MARIDIKSSNTGGGGGGGNLQLASGASMDATLRSVTDTSNTASPLKLSTASVQVNSPLRITTSDASGFYLDAEDSATNNRFSIKRDPSSQEVTLDFASNPAGSTTLVGAIRTYQDGVNLSNAMSFIEDGSIGVGTNTPVGILHLKKTAANTRLAIDGDAGFNRLISYRTAGLQRFGLYVNNTAESGSNVGSDFAVRAYNDAGTLLSTPLFIKRSTGNVGIGTTAPTALLQVENATTGVLLARFKDAYASGSFIDIKQDSTLTDFTGLYWGNEYKILSRGAGGATILNVSSNVVFADGFLAKITITPTEVQIGSISGARLGIKGSGSTSATTSLLVQNSAGNSALQVRDDNNVFVINNSTDAVLNVSNGSNFGLSIFGFQNSPVIGSFSSIAFGQYATSKTQGALTSATMFLDVANRSVGIGTTSPNSTSILDLTSTTKGFLPPRMTNAQRAAITTPAVGLMVYCTDAVEGLYVYKSTGWTFVI
jgi:hypothetical protein